MEEDENVEQPDVDIQMVVNEMKMRKKKVDPAQAKIPKTRKYADE